MAKIADVQEVSLDLLRPYEQNAKKHGPEQVEKLKASMQEFGFLTPCLIDGDYNLIAGHGRVIAAKELGLETVPCVFIEGLSEEQRRAYILADNRLGELGEWDFDIVFEELEELDDFGFDVELTGFELPKMSEWFDKRERGDTSREEGNDEYNEFLEKFEIKKTTDDCYTPDGVYDAVADWVAKQYKLKREDFVRPFYPGGDYQAEKYKSTDVVVDNPPFSILSEIIRFYCENGIRFFLFAPSLTLFGSGRECDVCYISTNAAITYENGATVGTSFITNLDDAKVWTAPELYTLVDAAVDEYRRTLKRELPKYSYPDEVITSTKAGYFAKYGQDFRLDPSECARISALDAQREAGKAIYGTGFLISEKAAAEKAAAEKAAAEKAAAHRWPLSEREVEIVKSMGVQNG